MAPPRILEFGRRLRQLWWRPSVRDEVAAELEFHLAMRTRELVSRGWSPEDARREAEQRFQSAARIAAECRSIGRRREGERRRRRMRTEWRQDLRYAWRGARRAPGFTVAVITTLALGIGATTAIFTVVNAVLLKRLPFGHPEQVVLIRQGSRGTAPGNHSAGNYLDLARDNRSFAAIAAYRDDVLTLRREGTEPLRVDAMQITSRFFDVFEIPPLVGRLPDSLAFAQGRVLVLSEGFWRKAFGADRGVIGSTVVLGGNPATIAAVMPASLRWPLAPDLWIGADGDLPTSPIQSSTDIRLNRGLGYLQVVARITAGVTPAVMTGDLDQIARRLERLAPKENERFGYQVTRVEDEIVGSSRSTLLMLLGSVTLVLLIAAANVANLLLARASSRSRELAVRAAIGADRGRLIRQLLTESVGLALAGGTLGVALAGGLTPLLARMAGPGLPRVEDVGIDLRVLAFAVGLSVVTGLLFGLSPALHLTTDRLAETLRSGGRVGAGRAVGSLRGALVVGELALAVIVVIGAALLTNSLFRLERIDPGFQTDRITAIDVSLTGTQYPNDSSQIRFYDALEREVAARLPRARASLVFPVPLESGTGSSFTVRRTPTAAPEQEYQSLIGLVSPGFFQTIGVPLLQGRDFSALDRANGARVAIINAALAKQLWPNEEPIGQTLYAGFPRPFTIVGVVGNIRSRRLDVVAEPTVYVPYHALMLPYLTLLVRSSEPISAVVEQVRLAVRTVDPALPLGEVRPFTKVVTNAVAAPRFRTLLLGGFAALGLVLGSIGVYGLLSYLVNVRRRDLAIQLALGASPARAVRQMVWSGVRLAVVGIGLGVAASWVLSRLMAGLLYGVAPHDPATFAGSAVGLGLVALLASYLPARRAARIDPLTVLRQD
jgi:predicted permease